MPRLKYWGVDWLFRRFKVSSPSSFVNNRPLDISLVSADGSGRESHQNKKIWNIELGNMGQDDILARNWLCTANSELSIPLILDR